MGESERLRVQGLVLDLGQDARSSLAGPRWKPQERTAPPAVFRVAEHGMSLMREVHANLVRAPGLERQEQLGHESVRAHYLISSGRVAPTPGKHGDALAVLRVASQGGLDAPLGGARLPPDEGAIDAADVPCLELRGQGAMRLVGTRDEKEP